MLGAKIFNALEAGLWLAIGLGCLVALLRRPTHRRKTLLMAAATFWAFGVSDILEIRAMPAGMPWWLWTIKVLCAVSLAACYLGYRRTRSRAS